MCSKYKYIVFAFLVGWWHRLGRIEETLAEQIHHLVHRITQMAESAKVHTWSAKLALPSNLDLYAFARRNGLEQRYTKCYDNWKAVMQTDEKRFDKLTNTKHRATKVIDFVYNARSTALDDLGRVKQVIKMQSVSAADAKTAEVKLKMEYMMRALASEQPTVYSIPIVDEEPVLPVNLSPVEAGRIVEDASSKKTCLPFMVIDLTPKSKRLHGSSALMFGDKDMPVLVQIMDVWQPQAYPSEQMSVFATDDPTNINILALGSWQTLRTAMRSWQVYACRMYKLRPYLADLCCNVLVAMLCLHVVSLCVLTMP